MKIMNFGWISLAGALLLQTPAYATEWVRIAGNEMVDVFIDKDSMRRTGNLAKVWLR